MKRVTISLPEEIVEEIDLRESNRSRFLTVAAKRELMRRRREDLELSLDKAHTDSLRVAESGIGVWAQLRVPEDDGILDPEAGQALRWKEDEGWREGE